MTQDGALLLLQNAEITVPPPPLPCSPPPPTHPKTSAGAPFMIKIKSPKPPINHPHLVREITLYCPTADMMSVIKASVDQAIAVTAQDATTATRVGVESTRASDVVPKDLNRKDVQMMRAEGSRRWVLKAATLEALFGILFHGCSNQGVVVDAENVFLETHQYFASFDAIFDVIREEMSTGKRGLCLFKYFSLPPPPPYAALQPFDRDVARMRVLSFLGHWVVMRSREFRETPVLVATLSSLIEDLKQPDAAFKRLEDQITACLGQGWSAGLIVERKAARGRSVRPSAVAQALVEDAEEAESDEDDGE
jgi:hypothetical protein